MYLDISYGNTILFRVFLVIKSYQAILPSFCEILDNITEIRISPTKHTLNYVCHVAYFDMSTIRECLFIILFFFNAYF